MFCYLVNLLVSNLLFHFAHAMFYLTILIMTCALCTLLLHFNSFLDNISLKNEDKITASSIAQWYSAGFECVFNPQSRTASYQRCYKNGTRQFPCLALNIKKGNTGSFSRTKIGKYMYWIKSGIENPSKSEVIGRCDGDEKTE